MKKVRTKKASPKKRAPTKSSAKVPRKAAPKNGTGQRAVTLKKSVPVKSAGKKSAAKRPSAAKKKLGATKKASAAKKPRAMKESRIKKSAPAKVPPKASAARKAPSKKTGGASVLAELDRWLSENEGSITVKRGVPADAAEISALERAVGGKLSPLHRAIVEKYGHLEISLREAWFFGDGVRVLGLAPKESGLDLGAETARLREALVHALKNEFIEKSTRKFLESARKQFVMLTTLEGVEDAWLVGRGSKISWFDDYAVRMVDGTFKMIAEARYAKGRHPKNGEGPAFLAILAELEERAELRRLESELAENLRPAGFTHFDTTRALCFEAEPELALRIVCAVDSTALSGEVYRILDDGEDAAEFRERIDAANRTSPLPLAHDYFRRGVVASAKFSPSDPAELKSALEKTRAAQGAYKGTGPN